MFNKATKPLSSIAIFAAVFTSMAMISEMRSFASSPPPSCIIKGEARLSKNAAIPANAKFIIRLQDEGLLDTAAPLIGAMRFDVGNKKVPFRFSIKVNCTKLKRAFKPGFAALIKSANGKLLYTNTVSHPFDPSKYFHLITMDKI